MPTNVLEKLVHREAEKIPVESISYETRELCTTEERTQTRWVAVEGDDTLAGDVTGGSTLYYPVTETVYEKVCRTVRINDGPEFRYEWSVDRNEGWNAGARTVDRVLADFLFSFQVNPANRTAVGVDTKRRGNHFRDLPYAFYFIGDKFRITEWGDVKYGPVSFSRHDVFSIVRVADSIVYKHNNAVVYNSQVPSTGSMIGIAAMYMGGDRVI